MKPKRAVRRQLHAITRSVATRSARDQVFLLEGELVRVLERASARETAARVAAGAVCKLLLRELDIDIVSHVVQLGPVLAKAGRRHRAALGGDECAGAIKC